MILLNNLKKIIKKEDKNMKFGKIAKEWIEYKRISIKDSTYYNYLFIIERYLNPKLQNLNIKEIQNYNDFVKELLENLSEKTVRDIINVLRTILKYYEDEYDYILQIKRINVPKLKKTRIKILSKREKETLEKYCIDKNSLKTLGIIVCLNTGMRVGEICALKWKNIDLENKCIYVEETLQRIYNKSKKETNIIIDKPKTDCSIRSIPINQKLYEVLKALKRKYKDDNYFCLEVVKKL